MENIKSIKLSDKSIAETELVRFIAICLRETGGIEYVSSNLEKIGEFNICSTAFSLLDHAEATSEINLEEYSSNQIKNICKIIVGTLIDCGDLETLTCYSETEAKKFLNNI
ncbi:MAG: hypothetical protein KC493_17965 [Bacteriovoracaceae bacterium]|nr:hypothetical protein [Bacteriovoracaceae bacterium]